MAPGKTQLSPVSMHGDSALKTSIRIAVLGPMFVSTTLAFSGLIAVMVFIAPKFKEISRDFEVQLSPLQKAFYSVSDFISGANGGFAYWVVLAPAVLAMMAGLGMMVFVPATRSLARALIIVLFVIAVLLVGITAVSCFGPLGKLMENLATNPAKSV